MYLDTQAEECIKTKQKIKTKSELCYYCTRQICCSEDMFCFTWFLAVKIQMHAYKLQMLLVLHSTTNYVTIKQWYLGCSSIKTLIKHKNLTYFFLLNIKGWKYLLCKCISVSVFSFINFQFIKNITWKFFHSQCHPQSYTSYSLHDYYHNVTVLVLQQVLK